MLRVSTHAGEARLPYRKVGERRKKAGETMGRNVRIGAKQGGLNKKSSGALNWDFVGEKGEKTFWGGGGFLKLAIYGQEAKGEPR